MLHPGYDGALYAPERFSEMAEILERIGQGEKVEQFETIRTRKDGKQIYIALTVSAIKDGTGKISGASAIGRDITERKRAEEALRRDHERIHRLVESNIIGIVIGDLKWQDHRRERRLFEARRLFPGRPFVGNDALGPRDPRRAR
jgi:PAS domain-containing protein